MTRGAILSVIVPLFLIGTSAYIVLEPFLNLQKSKWSKTNVAISVVAIELIAVLVWFFASNSPALAQFFLPIGLAGTSAGTLCVLLPPVRFLYYFFNEFDGKISQYAGTLMVASFPLLVLFVIALCATFGTAWYKVEPTIPELNR